MAKEKIYGVFGLGTFGSQVCKDLNEKGAKVIAVDNREKVIDKIKDSVSQAMLIDSMDEEAMRSAGLENIDVAVVGIGENMNASIITAAILKRIGIPFIIARAISDIHAQILRQVGVSEVIYIEIEEGSRLANRLSTPDLISSIPFSQNQSLAQIKTPKALVRKTILQANLRKEYNLNIVSIKRTEQAIDKMGNPTPNEVVINPLPNTVLREEDILVIIGSDEDINKLRNMN